MKRVTHYDRAASTAERVIREQGITALPVDPIKIAESVGIEVAAKPAASGGVSGMLIRVGDQFAIMYATHIQSPGFRRFSIAHELGHYFIEGHVDAVFAGHTIHESRAGFVSSLDYEIEADQFAARLLMPNALFSAALREAGEGLAAVESLASICCVSLTATAIRYAECSREPVAIVVSKGNSIEWCTMSNALKDAEGIDWIRKNQPLPLNSATRHFNSDSTRIRHAERTEGQSAFQDWFGGSFRVSVTEEVIGLGSYERALTVLHGIEFPEDADGDEEDDDNISDSWTPRFRR